MNRTIFGNGGSVEITEEGMPIAWNPSDEVESGDHDGYTDIASFDMEEWRTAYGYAEGDGPERIDILDIGYTTDTGYYEPATRGWRDDEFVGQGPAIITGPHANVDMSGARIQSDPMPVTGPLPEWAKDGSSLPRDRWFAEARRAARILYAYEELVDDWEANFERCFEDGADPIEIVRQIGENLGLIPTNILIPR